MRIRHPWRWAVSFALLVAAVAVALVLAASGTHGGTGVPPGAGGAGLRAVSLSQNAAHDYNPFGTGPENENRISNVIDNDPNTFWSTEQYYSGTLKKAGGVGTGLYLDASPGVVAKAIQIKTGTPGFAVQVYAANQEPPALAYGDPAALSARGWQGPIGQSTLVTSGQRVALAVPHAFRYYLLWLTTLPPNMQSAQINELTLLQ